MFSHRPDHSWFLVGLLDYIQCLHWADVCKTCPGRPTLEHPDFAVHWGLLLLKWHRQQGWYSLKTNQPTDFRLLPLLDHFMFFRFFSLYFLQIYSLFTVFISCFIYLFFYLFTCVMPNVTKTTKFSLISQVTML